MYGITPTGFLKKPRSVILAEIEADQRAEIDPNLDLSPDQPISIMNGIVADHYAEVWDMAEQVYNSYDKGKAAGDALEMLGKLTGTPKRPASYSVVDLTVDVDAGVTLQTDQHFAASSVHHDQLWTPEAGFVSPADGTHTVRFRAQNTGPIPAVAHEITVITTPVTGWNGTPDNAAPAVLGRVADNDAELGLRMTADAARAGSSTVRALQADVLECSPDVQSVKVFENVTDTTDASGLPPHSFEVLVYDAPSVSDDLIAQTIWDGRPAGIRAIGTTSGTAHHRDPVTGEATGDAETVPFSRVTPVPIYLTYQLRTTAGYPGDPTFSGFIAAFAQAAYRDAGAGIPVHPARAMAVAFLVPGVVDVRSLTLGTAPSPAGTTSIPIGPRELPTFDPANVTVIP